MSRKQKVAYFYDPEIGDFYYGQGHPMKPHRVRMAHSLLLHYGLYAQMDCFRPRRAEVSDMTTFHAEDYVSFLSTVTQDKEDELRSGLEVYNLLEDCPVFDGLWKYCQIYSGGSIGAAVKLNFGAADVAINWAGGLHHGKKAEASGFCYVNDIVLAIIELLKYHQRVLYIDIDVHHGDGVEEAFLTTDRVLTLSFHKFGNNFFPGTGDIINTGHGRGRHYAVNVPLQDGITDTAYASIFEPVVEEIVQRYRPEAIVLQCGADSLAGDRLGLFNVSSAGHAACVRFVKSFNLPLMLLGGGGYKIINVARCWALETGVALGAEMDDALPASEYYDYFGPSHHLAVEPKASMPDGNTREYLDALRVRVMEHLRNIDHAPSVAFHERPPNGMDLDGMENVGGGGMAAGSRPQMWGGERDSEEEEAYARQRERDAEFDAQFRMNGGGGAKIIGGSGRARMDMSFRDAEDASGGAVSPQRIAGGGGGSGLRSPSRLPSMLRPPPSEPQGNQGA